MRQNTHLDRWLSCILKNKPATRWPQDDVIKLEHFPRYWTFVWGIHRSPVNSPHKGQWRGALMFSLICAWTNGWVNHRDAGDLKHHRAHYDVTAMPHLSNLAGNPAHSQVGRYSLLSTWHRWHWLKMLGMPNTLFLHSCVWRRNPLDTLGEIHSSISIQE